MDKDYWEKYYLQHGRDLGLKKHSSFAEFCRENFFNNKR